MCAFICYYLMYITEFNGTENYSLLVSPFSTCNPHLLCFLVVFLNRLERKTVKRKKVFATLKVLGTVLEQLTEEISPEEAERLIPEEVFFLNSKFHILFSAQFFCFIVCFCTF